MNRPAAARMCCASAMPGDEILEAVAPAGMSRRRCWTVSKLCQSSRHPDHAGGRRYAAQEADLREGDLVYSVGGSVISLDLPLRSDKIRRNAGTEVSMTVLCATVSG